MHDTGSDEFLAAEAAALVAESTGVDLVNPRFTEVTEGNGGTIKGFFAADTAKGVLRAFVKGRRSTQIHEALWYTDDQGLLAREYHVYSLLARLDAPHARVMASRYDGPSRWTLVLEDLSCDYVLGSGEGADLSWDALTSAIDSYARVHSACLKAESFANAPERNWLQPEEGSQVDIECGRNMWETFACNGITASGIGREEFRASVETLCACRDKLCDYERVLVFNDFHPTNVAFPKAGGPAVLFDWELAGIGLPAFDILNVSYGLGPSWDAIVDLYCDKMADADVRVDPNAWSHTVAYAKLSGAFYALWLLHTKLKVDPDGRLPRWMRTEASSLLSGKLVSLAEEARKVCLVER